MILHNQCWKPLESLLHQEPLLSFKSYLSTISYQPSKKDIFNVFKTDIKDIKVVILGQDPYPTQGDACGYAFIPGNRNRKPASLRVIENELEKEGISDNLDMRKWIDQGVFLLNTALTVESGNAGSHLKTWEDFTIKTIKLISKKNPCIWLLWGKKAQSFSKYIDNSFLVKGYDDKTIEDIPVDPYKNYIFQSPHPVSEIYSAGKSGFYGCNHFLLTNKILLKTKASKINW